MNLKSLFTSSRKAIYIAEIGINHNGDLKTALDMISKAKNAGADAVKFQTMQPESLYSVYTADLLSSGTETTPDTSHIDFFKQFSFTRDELLVLQNHANKLDVLFFSSVFDLDSLQLLEDIHVPLYKIASSEVTNHQLLREVAKTNKPTILSTGMATETEIKEAIDIFHSQSNAELALLHCVSEYPLSPENANLSRITSLQNTFDHMVGFSDHSGDIFPSILASCYGARIFEKHFTVDKNYDCPDKVVSIDPSQFSEMIDLVEKTISMAGSGTISFGSAEQATARSARRSLFALQDIPAGKIIDEQDLIALRPGTGIPASNTKAVIGKKSSVNIKKNYQIRPDYLD